MIIRVVFFLLIVGIAVVAPTPILAICACAYALRYTAYELIILAMCIDGFYGIGSPILIPYYTIVACIGLIVIEWIKPHISVYNQ